MAQHEDPYDILLVNKSASAAEIRKSYQELAKKVRSRSGILARLSQTPFLARLWDTVTKVYYAIDPEGYSNTYTCYK